MITYTILQWVICQVIINSELKQLTGQIQSIGERMIIVDFTNDGRFIDPNKHWTLMVEKDRCVPKPLN